MSHGSHNIGFEDQTNPCWILMVYYMLIYWLKPQSLPIITIIIIFQLQSCMHQYVLWVRPAVPLSHLCEYEDWWSGWLLNPLNMTSPSVDGHSKINFINMSSIFDWRLTNYKRLLMYPKKRKRKEKKLVLDDWERTKAERCHPSVFIETWEWLGISF